jgi:hypothetical protein
MNKILLLCFVLLALSIPASAQNIASIGNFAVDTDVEIRVPLYLNDSIDVGSVGINLSYDPAVVSASSFDPADIGSFTGSYDPDNSNNTGGWITINTSKTGDGLNGNLIIGYLTLKALGSAGSSSPLDLNFLSLIDGNGSEIVQRSTIGGTFTIEEETLIAPVITIQPSDKTVNAGETATFSVAATGTAPLSYQWQKDGVNITGATDDSYTTPATALSDNGSTFQVIVTSDTGSVTSDAATLTVTTSFNIIKNSGFESGTDPWLFYTYEVGSFLLTSPIFEGNNSARVVVNSGGTNIQLYQKEITLKPNTRYRLSFEAYSTTGHDLTVHLFKHASPYTSYGLNYKADLGTNWQTFSTEFTTEGLTETVNDGRLMFWLAPFATAGDTYHIDDIHLEIVSEPGINLINNPAFESGTASWLFYTDTMGTFSAGSTVFEGNNSARVSLNSGGTNVQLYQKEITLKPNTLYRLSFAAYSTTGHDLTVHLFKHASPYTSYGLNYKADLGTNWQTFTTEFTTEGLTETVNDGRLMFWLAPFATAGDTYHIDDIHLEMVSEPGINLINNPAFESGTSSWLFYTNTMGTFIAGSTILEGNNTAEIVLNNSGTNIQLYQKDLTLEPDTRYRLSFEAYSTTGHDLTVNLFKHASPYTSYGLNYKADLSTDWKTFSTEFTTEGLTETVNDGRLMFWLAPFAAAGDTYYIDNVRLEKV